MKNVVYIPVVLGLLCGFSSFLTAAQGDRKVKTERTVLNQGKHQKHSLSGASRGKRRGFSSAGNVSRKTTAASKAGESGPDSSTVQASLQSPRANSSGDEQVGKTSDGKIVYEGAKGGHYYLNSTGDKVYVKDYVGAKIVGKTERGLMIYEGPHGAHFYYNESGNKIYVK